MLRKFRFILFLFLLFVGINVVYSQDCYFNVISDDCQRFSSSFVNFDLSFTPNDLYQNYSAIIYRKDNPENKVLIDINGNSVRNINPFLDSGVYVLDVFANTKSGLRKEEKKEFIIDKTQPLPPVIAMNLESSVVKGSTIFKGENVFADIIGFDGSVNTKSVLSNGNFELNLNLNNGINLVNLYSKNTNGISSVKIDRIIYAGGIPEENLNLQVSSININTNLDKINFRTYKEGNDYVTSKRNFLVVGNVDAQDGAVVYVNGIKSIVKSGKFAVVVLLNQGDNKIKVENEGSNLVSYVKVKYLNTRFQFLTINMKKIVKSNQLNFNGTANLNLPFNVYVNGKFVKKVMPTNGKFNVDLVSLDKKRNFVYLEGFNGQYFDKIVYKDEEKPRGVLNSNSNLANGQNLVFKISDDVGVDFNSLVLKVGEKSYSGDDFEIKGDYFLVKLENFSDGNYNYNLKYSDRSGREGNVLSGSISINSNNTLIKRFDLGNFGYRLGNTLFLNSNHNQIVLKPSKFIAFNSIYLDGVRVEDYEIKQNGDVYLNLNGFKRNGTLNFVFINFNHHSFEENFTYYTDLEKPKVILDNIVNPNVVNGNFLEVTGKIIDSNFDWSSLMFNSKTNFIRFGDFFEAKINLDRSGVSDLKITGQDYSLNQIENGVFYGVLYNDGGKTSVNILGPANFGIIGTLSNFDASRNKNYITSYSGLNLYNSYLNPSNFKLAVSEMEGMRVSNILGQESSLKKFNSNDIFNVDSIKPKVYYVSDGPVNKILIDGTLSEINSINIIKGGNIVSFSECSDKISKYSKCLISNDFMFGDISVDVSDKAGNRISKVLTQNDLVDISDVINSNSNLAEIYFNGNDNGTFNSNYFIQGNIKSDSLVNSVKINGGKNCIFDDVSFVCNVSLIDGINSFTVSVDNGNGVVEKSISIEKYNVNFGLNLINISGNGVYHVGDKYYISNSNFDLSGGVSNNVRVSLLIDNNEYLNLGEISSNFTVNIGINNQIAQKENDDFYVQLKAEDEYGNSELSNKIRIIYNRVVKTLVNIFVQ